MFLKAQSQPDTQEEYENDPSLYMCLHLFLSLSGSRPHGTSGRSPSPLIYSVVIRVVMVEGVTGVTQCSGTNQLHTSALAPESISYLIGSKSLLQFQFSLCSWYISVFENEQHSDPSSAMLVDVMSDKPSL